MLGVGGRWQVVDGVAVIRLDSEVGATCDVAQAAKLDPPVELRCIGVDPTDRVPAGSLLCQASAPEQLLELGMPMTVSSAKPAGYRDSAPSGGSFALGSPGLDVKVEHDRNAHAPTITFKSAAVTLVESDYHSPPIKPPQQSQHRPALPE